MKLLTIKFGGHDDNFCYHDGHQTYYCKSERKTNIKHHSYKSLYAMLNGINEVWGIDYRDMDAIGFIGNPQLFDRAPSLNRCFPDEEYTDLIPGSKVYRINHHYAHALSVNFFSDVSPDVSFVVDGEGQRRTWTVYKNQKIVKEGLASDHGSIGNLMAYVSSTLGVSASHNVDLAGKVMGLQAYGKINPAYLSALSKYDIRSVNEVFSYKNWIPYSKGYTNNDWIRTVHERVGYILVEFFEEYASPDDVIFYSGGVAQNVIWNTLLKSHFKNLHILPHSSDEGLSIGAMERLRMRFGLPKMSFENFPYSQTDEGTEQVSIETTKEVARMLADGKIVGWYQGNGEVGPRALGNRSILMDPRIQNGKEIINAIKRRENYRPFGASVLLDDFEKHFSTVLDTFENPYMLYVADCKDPLLQSITHVDGTCRVQTVDKENRSFRILLEEFKNITGCSVLLNTSLNVSGKPIASTINDAKEVLSGTTIDAVVIGNTIHTR